MTKLRSCMFAVLACAACGHSTKSTPTTPPTPTAPTASASDDVLAIGEIKLYAGDQLGLHLRADGHLEAVMGPNNAMQEVAILKTDGTIQPTEKKDKSARVNADGTLTGPNGEVAPFKLDGAALIAGDKRVTIDDKGMVLINGAAAPADKRPLRVEGANDPKLQRTALILLAMMMTGSGASEPASASTPAEAAPAPARP